MILETLVIVLVLFSLVVMAFLVTILFQLRRAAKDITVAVDAFNKRLPVILENVENLTGGLNKTVNNLNSGIEEVSAKIERIWPAMGVFGHLAPLLSGRITGAFSGKLGGALAVIKGIKVFLAVLRAGENRERPTRKDPGAPAGL